MIRSPDPGEGEPAGESTGLACFDPVAVAPRLDGWTPERQRAFIEELADCGVVREAAARVGMTERSARRLRRRADADGFDRAWREALGVGRDRLVSLAFDRAVNGSVRRKYFRGEVVGEETVYDNRLLAFLIGKNSEAIRNTGWENRIDSLCKGEDERHHLLPGEHGARTWLEPWEMPGEDGEWIETRIWVTDFPPPHGFDGHESGMHGDEGYFRTLTAEEQAAVDLWEEKKREQEDSRRRLYFDRLV